MAAFKPACAFLYMSMYINSAMTGVGQSCCLCLTLDILLVFGWLLIIQMITDACAARHLRLSFTKHCFMRMLLQEHVMVIHAQAEAA